jgi:hypothetical protein
MDFAAAARSSSAQLSPYFLLGWLAMLTTAGWIAVVDKQTAQ